jgi:hypothetical protein
MSSRTMPFSSRIDIVLCTKERKKFPIELDRNLMCRNLISWNRTDIDSVIITYIANKLTHWLAE